MRKIKFRAWNGRKMHYDVTIANGRFIAVENDNETLWYWHDPSEQVAIMQFTGYKDKNVKEIYEGDVVSLSYGTAIVKFINECGAFMLQWIDDPEANLELLAFSNEGYRRGRSRTWEKDIPEVIGNIYENPELLKP